MMVKIPFVLLALILFGIMRWPLESAQTRDWKARHLLAPDLDLSMRERLGQNSYAAVIGGARSFIASIQNLRAFGGWENKDWGAVEQNFRLMQDLQPRVPSYWEMGAWHMAYNAAGYYQYDWPGPRGQPSPEAVARVRMELRDRYIGKGREMYADGTRNNPGNWQLCEQAGMLAGDAQKLPDQALSAKYYAMAAACPGAPLRVHRFEAYALSYLPDSRGQALRQLTSLYHNNPQNHVPTLLGTLLDLQLEQNIPPAERVPLEKFGATPLEQYQQLRGYTAFRRSHHGECSPAFARFLTDMEDKLGIPAYE